MTHTYFSLDVYQKLPKNIKTRIKNLEYLKLFAQGSDPIMFYNLFIGKKAKYHKHIQYQLHTTKTQDFFINLINYINDNNLNNNEQVLSYLYGNICHYYLDSETHPFIIYKTGRFNKKNKETYKYNSLHQEMEYIIDMYYISKKETTPPHKFKIYNHIYKNNSFSKELTNCINNTIKNTYNIPNFSQALKKSSKEMKLFFRLFNYDKTGIKKRIYSLVDSITPDSIIKLKELSFSNNYQEKIHYLNLNNNTWNHPTNKEEIYNYSFPELYEIATQKAINCITEVTKMLDTKKTDQEQLKKIFKNLSYTTGKNCNEKLTFKYFEF